MIFPRRGVVAVKSLVYLQNSLYREQIVIVIIFALGVLLLFILLAQPLVYFIPL
jgi:hypothetical protein